MADGEVKIVDEFTGRTLDGRRWSDGLHQAVEAKERVRIREENHTWATVTLQNYFRLYEKLSGMTGTAETEAGEFAGTYDLTVVPIPTNREMLRDDQADLIFKTEAAKFAAVSEDVSERNALGQPVLIGTASVAKSEQLSRVLSQNGIAHEVLNAKQHFREAEIVAQAGRLGAVTVATNMAGRGVDILLGGSPSGLAVRQLKDAGVDLESDEGRAQLVALEEELSAACKAEGEKVRELGGLYVLGSERHESRRIDNQLRGRSGRQGEPGESRFFLSLEDDLLRLFASGAISWVMDRALPEDVPIEAKMVTKAIERAQNTVEGRNAETRKEVLKYDEVMNQQRKVIYQRRIDVIDGDDLHDDTVDLLSQTLTNLVVQSCPSDYPEEWELDQLLTEVALYYPSQFTRDDLAQASTQDQVIESLLTEALAFYELRSSSMPGGEEMAREIERDVMLQIIDQRWRDHLSEMDYLREGINLRAMGQQDPLVAWQQEGFSMFGKLMEAIDDDYLRYVFHVDAVTDEAADPALEQAVYAAAEDPVDDMSFAQATLAAAQGETQNVASAQMSDEMGETMAPIVKDATQKVGRNEPCWCGSGRKFKLCHGAS